MRDDRTVERVKQAVAAHVEATYFPEPAKGRKVSATERAMGVELDRALDALGIEVEAPKGTSSRFRRSAADLLLDARAVARGQP